MDALTGGSTAGRRLAAPRVLMRRARQLWSIVHSGGQSLAFRGKGGLAGYGLWREFKKVFWQSMNIGCVIDVGANCGQFGYAAIRAFPEADVHSIEPNPQSYQALRRLADRYRRWYTYPVVAGPRPGTTVFHLHSYAVESSVLAPISQAAFSPMETVTLHMDVLDSILGGVQIRRPALLKLDVQGYELAVLQGAIRTLESVDIALVEIGFLQRYADQADFSSINAVLARAGFHFAGVFDSCKRPSGLPDQMDALFIRRGVLETWGPLAGERVTAVQVRNE